MSYPFDTPIHTNLGYSYTFVSYHHIKSNPNKSLWVLNQADELQMFLDTIIVNNIVFTETSSFGFNIICNNSQLEIVGHTYTGLPLFIGKFIKKNTCTDWHGYPGNHVANSQDIPPDAILENWISQGVSLRDIKRIKKGKQL